MVGPIKFFQVELSLRLKHPTLFFFVLSSLIIVFVPLRHFFETIQSRNILQNFEIRVTISE